MVSISSWNDGYETHDTKKTKGRLLWVRQNILMGDVRWAKLWLRDDAAQVWAGWTAIVWCAAQSDVRGAITNAEDVSILSRVPVEMVEKALEWGFSCGFIDSRQSPDTSATVAGNHREGSATLARQSPDDLPQTPEIIATTLRDVTLQDVTKQKTLPVTPRAKTNEAPPHKPTRPSLPRFTVGVDFKVQPPMGFFVQECQRAFSRSWQPWALESHYKAICDRGWKDKDNNAINHWGMYMGAVFDSVFDHWEFVEKLPLGDVVRSLDA